MVLVWGAPLAATLPPQAGYSIQAQSKTGTPHVPQPVDRDAEHTVTVRTDTGGVEIH
ncbi:hypothetical protein AAHZ94_26395 [Streptomyces sp. HSW2009]|uniref:hypothetical protein n=1 Tax=Streptomyces sp. HSW2009 TaxID=3142890 RepID=UPI0032EACDF7